MFAPNDEVDDRGTDQVDARKDTTDSVVTAGDVEQDSEVKFHDTSRRIFIFDFACFISIDKRADLEVCVSLLSASDPSFCRDVIYVITWIN